MNHRKIIKKKLEDYTTLNQTQAIRYDQQEQIIKLRESLNEVAQNRFGWENRMENVLTKLLEKRSECEDSTIHRSFYLELLEKLRGSK